MNTTKQSDVLYAIGKSQEIYLQMNGESNVHQKAMNYTLKLICRTNSAIESVELA